MDRSDPMSLLDSARWRRRSYRAFEYEVAIHGARHYDVPWSDPPTL